VNNNRRGGRPDKKPDDLASEKINCWVTKSELEYLTTAYEQAKAGRKLSFSIFLKGILLRKKQSVNIRPSELLLTAILQLQACDQQLNELKKVLEAAESLSCRQQIQVRIDEELAVIRKTITSITTWLYES
jgi:hypothetical protein